MKRSILVIPEFSNTTYSGQRKLNDLAIQSERLTATLRQLRAEGFSKVTFEMLLHRLQKEDRALYEKIEPSMFLFTGKKVIPNEEAFFSWYAGTPEGRSYKARVEQLAPDFYGHIVKLNY